MTNPHDSNAIHRQAIPIPARHSGCDEARPRRRAAPAAFPLLETIMTVKILRNDKGNPPGKLADAELHFSDGPLAGLKLIGFSVWERKTGSGRNVTFPARQYSVNGERRSFALLRPVTDATAQEQIRTVILQAYAEHEAETAVA
jgi:hypothetical protein